MRLATRAVSHPLCTVRPMPPAGTTVFAPVAIPSHAPLVRVPIPTACGICRAPASAGYSMCTSCRDVAIALQRPLVPVSAIALVGTTSALYRALRQYKSGEPGVAARQSQWLSGVLHRFAERHLRCVAPDGVDVTVVVPSSRDGRPGPHPFESIVRAAACFPMLLDALVPGAGTLAHRRPAPDGYRLRRDVAGRRVLLVDDVYTSGAHLQTAASALEQAGARCVEALVVGRFVRSPPAPRAACPCCER